MPQLPPNQLTQTLNAQQLPPSSIAAASPSQSHSPDYSPSETTQAHDSSSSFKNRDVRTLLPLTLKQLNSVSTSGESNFAIDGVDINTVAIVGRVSRMENRITHVDFVVDDGTGFVRCNFVVESLKNGE